MAIETLLQAGRRGENVFLEDVRRGFAALTHTESRTVQLALRSLDSQKVSEFDVRVPVLEHAEADTAGIAFVRNYLYAEIYNLLSSLGGRVLTMRLDRPDAVLESILGELPPRFGVGLARQDRRDYGNCVNVIDRMVEAIDRDGAVDPTSEHCGLRIEILGAEAGAVAAPAKAAPTVAGGAGDGTASALLRVSAGLDGRAICGIDIGGTDIKLAVALDGAIVCFKEFDWNPAAAVRAVEVVRPIVVLTRLMRVYAALVARFGERAADWPAVPGWDGRLLDKDTAIADVDAAVTTLEKWLGGDLRLLDAVGVSFPDVVVRDRIVGGETTKTRGIKRNAAIEFEAEFRQITDLNDQLSALCRPGGAVKIMNDGPMSAYTAAVEMAAVDPGAVVDGVFAYSLGTELGTGWVDGNGVVPEMPLECYNFIIDLGDFPAQAFPAEDVRSTINVNTGLAGTLQRYTSQSGVFRLALSYFRERRPDLFAEIFAKGFVEKLQHGDRELWVVPTAPKDLRKAFLEHVMALPQRENDETVNAVFRRIGVYLAMTWNETVHTVAPACRTITLFGRVVKNQRCFELIREGALQVNPDIRLEVADSSMANTRLMQQLEADPTYTVAQFAQAVGAIYFGNQGLID